MQFLLDTLASDDLFVDIGANVGSYTVLASKVRGSRTIAVEPDPDTVRALRRNIELNSINDLVHVVESALGARSGTIAFTVGRDTINRVADILDEKIRNVQLNTLDEILEGNAPRIIKIDVEGYEAEVFRGATKTLADPRLEAIISETANDEVLALLAAAGFSRRFYNPETRSFQDTQAFESVNTIFVR